MLIMHGFGARVKFEGCSCCIRKLPLFGGEGFEAGRSRYCGRN